MKTRIHIAASLIVLSLAMAGAAFAQSSDQLGKVEFPNSCSPAAQEKLLRGIKMLHSFCYSATQRAFEEVPAKRRPARSPPGAMASILMANPLQGVGASPEDAPHAQTAIETGRKMGAKTGARARLPQGGGGLLRGLRQPSRARAPARAREGLRGTGGEIAGDDKAQIFYAVYLAATQLPYDQTYSAYLKAAGILEKRFAKHPDHRGVTRS